jgi:hypothetical protein
LEDFFFCSFSQSFGPAEKKKFKKLGLLFEMEEKVRGCLQMPNSTAEAGAERDSNESKVMSLREEEEMRRLRFGGKEDWAVVMMMVVDEKELRAQTVAVNGIVS